MTFPFTLNLFKISGIAGISLLLSSIASLAKHIPYLFEYALSTFNGFMFLLYIVSFLALPLVTLPSKSIMSCFILLFILNLFKNSTNIFSNSFESIISNTLSYVFTHGIPPVISKNSLNHK